MCELHSKLGKSIPCSEEAQCKNYVNVVVPRHDLKYLPRLRHIMRLEAMVSVGCHFQLHDLSPVEWDELIALASERNTLDEEIGQLRAKQSDPSPGLNAEEAKGIAAAREESGVPPPGRSLFG